MNLSNSDRIILFRFHKDVDIALERIKILKYFNPGVQVHVLFGGDIKSYEMFQEILNGYVDSFWVFRTTKDPTWKWLHSDLITKHWFKDYGHTLNFQHVYSYEYDLLTLAPLDKIYPNITADSIALSAAEKFTLDIENRWSWTSEETERAKFRSFQSYMKSQYNIDRQNKVCLGPGPLLSRKFLEDFALTDDIDYVHEEIAIPAYAEVFGVEIKNNGLHPGFFKHSDEDKYFTCVGDTTIDIATIKECIDEGSRRRAFHPVKYMVTLDQH